MVRWVDPTVNAIQDLCQPGEGGYDVRKLVVGPVTGGITR
jgi:hypothetical protein